MIKVKRFCGGSLCFVIFLIIVWSPYLFLQAQTVPPKPGPVSNVVISDITTSSLKISWNPASNTDYYNIYREESDYYRYGIFIGSTTKNFFIDRTVLPNSKYFLCS